ncbi:RIP metalloprotease RseP [Variovorax sp. PCZ-1]|uniref:RIP metalloprotease RseP n=1 Tax=Variovorax sp. PCZ-1 TaxID=2835533 RepID=UPI001BD11F11|nr:RIP metalloprotease RseP [Variovorax sp. PCZ-1]MBS7806486.1 RIP metalloprotease RseP [Variovorax sp. PCZ-1]
MLTIVAFVVALGLLIAIHEYGHYRVAVACGVQVTRFSVGFGTPLLKWKPKKQHPGQDTEFVIAAFPLGGYVKMVGQGEAAPAHLKAVSFDAQPLRKRAAIVAAGPVANLLLAVALYAIVNWMGSEQAKAIIAQPPVTSLAAAAGLKAGDEILSVSGTDSEAEPIRSMDDLRWHLTRAALDRYDLILQVREAGRDSTRQIKLPMTLLDIREADAQMYRKIGLAAPLTQPVMGELVAGGAGDKAGLKQGDRVLAIDGVAMRDGGQLRDVIRASVLGDQAVQKIWTIERAGQTLELPVAVSVKTEGGNSSGRIEAFVGGAPAMTHVSYGFFEGLSLGVQKTWDISMLTLRMMGKMLIGEASLKNLSGPLTIADVAGKSASLGLVQYLIFLALISVSLGVLNLLPLPVLDGGHLMYYLWEAVTGKAVSEVWLERLQRGGVAVLMAMMAVALFNDVTRIFG